jgi:hypothetical protein
MKKIILKIRLKTDKTTKIIKLKNMSLNRRKKNFKVKIRKIKTRVRTHSAYHPRQKD